MQEDIKSPSIGTMGMYQSNIIILIGLNGKFTFSATTYSVVNHEGYFFCNIVSTSFFQLKHVTKAKLFLSVLCSIYEYKILRESFEGIFDCQ